MLDEDRGHTDVTAEEHLSGRFEVECPADQNGTSANSPAGGTIETPIINVGMLIAENPTLNPPVISGLLRLGETCNVIAAPKVGKSWLAYGLALATATGGDWLGCYQCERGKVLLIDNELHPGTLANRIPKVAEALEIPERDYRGQLDILSLRGRLLDLHGIRKLLKTVEAGTYAMIVLDAWYRCLPAGVSENDNAQIALLYNLVDQITGQLDCAWINIHHASKGQQGGKAVTDVGAGAGSQARAADTHIILREHEEEGIVVLDAAVRSFAPVEPLALRWEYPIWHPADEFDTDKLKGRLTQGEQRQSARDAEGMEIVRTVLSKQDATAREIRQLSGLSKDRCDRLLGMLFSEENITSVETTRRGNTCLLYHLTGDVVD